MRDGFSLVAVEAQACGIAVFETTNVTKEIDCGGVRFLDLNKVATYCPECIYKEFKEHKNVGPNIL